MKMNVMKFTNSNKRVSLNQIKKFRVLDLESYLKNENSAAEENYDPEYDELFFDFDDIDD